MKVGDSVVITEGSSDGYYGKVIALKANNRIDVKREDGVMVSVPAGSYHVLDKVKAVKQLPKHIRICPTSDGKVSYFPWNEKEEDYELAMKPADALRAIANGAMAEIAVINPDEEHLPASHQSVYEAVCVFVKS